MCAKTKNKINRSRRKKSTFIMGAKNTQAIKNTILTVIVIATLTVVFYFIFAIIATPEFLVKREVESITADYYENYFYPNILKNNSLSLDDVSNPDSAKEKLSGILDNYQNTGFPRVTLNQLLLYDNRKNYASASSISEYCDLDKTIIKIFSSTDS